MKRLLLLLTLLFCMALFSQTNFADSQRISVHELQSKAYSDSFKQNQPENKSDGRYRYVPVFIAVAFILLYAFLKRRNA